MVALHFAPASNEITAVYASTDEQPGQVLVWNLETASVVRELTLAWIHPSLTTLSARGNILATVEDRPTHVAQYQEQFEHRIRGVHEVVEVWDVAKGERRKVLGWGRFTTRAIYVSDDGQQLLTVFEEGVRLQSTDPSVTFGGQSIWAALSPEDASYRPEIFVVGAFVHTHPGFALGLMDGDVQLEAAVGELLTNPSGFLPAYPMQDSSKPGALAPVALAFDMTGEWLAILRTDSVELRKLNSWVTRLWPPWLNEELAAAETDQIALSPDNAIMALGTSAGWQLRRTRDLELLAEQRDHPISSLASRDDGCVVAFGRQDGVVEVWAVGDR